MQSTDRGRDGADWRKIRNPYLRVTAMLAKLTSKNQLTLPKAVVNQYPGTTYFEVRAEKGEYRMLPNLQRSLDDGAEVGHVVADAWIHLGGVLPTPEANVRDVVRRVWAASDALDATGTSTDAAPVGARGRA